MAVSLSLLASAGLAGESCICRYKGATAAEGEVVCIATLRGQRLARCDKVLNNTSWTFLDTPCEVPTASAERMTPFPATPLPAGSS